MSTNIRSKVRTLNHKGRGISRRLRDEERVAHLANDFSEPESGLIGLQHQLGNLAVQRLLSCGDGRNSLGLDRATLCRLEQEHGPLAQAIINQAVAQIGLVQRQEAEVAQAQATTGRVTIEDVQLDYYDVTGSTLAAVGQQLDPEEWGRCHYQYEYSYETTNGRATKVDITLKLTIRLPRWRGEGWDKASPAVKREWQRMLEALRGHEDEHAAIDRRWAPVFRDRLLNQRERDLRRRYRRTLRGVNRENRQLDGRTQYGRKQGVSLDVSIQ